MNGKWGSLEDQRTLRGETIHHAPFYYEQFNSEPMG